MAPRWRDCADIGCCGFCSALHGLCLHVLRLHVRLLRGCFLRSLVLHTRTCHFCPSIWSLMNRRSCFRLLVVELISSCWSLTGTTGIRLRCWWLLGKPRPSLLWTIGIRQERYSGTHSVEEIKTWLGGRHSAVLPSGNALQVRHRMAFPLLWLQATSTSKIYILKENGRTQCSCAMANIDSLGNSPCIRSVLEEHLAAPSRLLYKDFEVEETPYWKSAIAGFGDDQTSLERFAFSTL